MIYYYLFRDMNNGHGEDTYTYQPFTTEKKLNQEETEKMMRLHNPLAGRLGSNIDDLYVVASDNGYEMKKYNCIYKLSQGNTNENLDPIPDCMKNWIIIKSIIGNY